MFSYVALAWDTDAEEASAAAQFIANSLTSDARWRVALHRPGIAVFSTGERPNINQAYPLGGGRGVVLGKLFRRDGAAPSLGHFTESPDDSDAVAPIEGHHLVERYWGRYVAFIEAEDGGFAVLRDPSAALPCFRMYRDGVDIVFSWLEDVLAILPSYRFPSVDWECLAAHIAFGELTGRPTALEGVIQVLPGELVQLGKPRGATSLLWNPCDHAGAAPLVDIAQASGALRRVVTNCAVSWASCYESVVLRLSGGVDSSILACCLSAQHTRTRITCLNYHSPGSDSDERPYARLAAARAQRELVELERDADYRLEQVLDVARTPSPTNYLGRLGARTDADLAAAVGAPALFTGTGGDQLFFEFSHWWPAADYLRRRGFDRGFLATALDAARLGKVSLWRATRLAVVDRFRTGAPPMQTKRHWALATETLWEPSSHPVRFLHPAHTEAFRLPIGKLMQVQQVTHFGGYYDPYQRQAAPELVNPLLSQPLIELCLRIPTYALTLGGRRRGLARHAFAQDLPPEIASRRSKGGLQEQISTVLARNLDFAREVLLDGELVRHRLLDRRRIESALEGGPRAAPGRAGEIHMYIGVEAWLQRWASSRRQQS
jgi:asparagine synthase (glutamine-hydrolysing)